MSHAWKNWIKQKGSDDHLAAVTANLLQCLGVDFDIRELRRTLPTHPDHPSLLSLAEMLIYWGVRAEGMQADINELSGDVCPAAAQLRDDSLVVLIGVGNGAVSFIHPQKGPVTESVSEFEKNWSGVLLRVRRIDGLAPVTCAHTKSREKRTRLSRYFFAVTLFYFMITLFMRGLSGSVYSDKAALYIVVKLAGLALCLLMTWMELSDSVALRSLCHIGKRLDCLKVLHSPAARIGPINVAEVGLVYFAGGLFALFLHLNMMPEAGLLRVLAWLTVLALPYTVFSIFYQTFVVRAWCWMCLSVMALLWLEFWVIHQVWLEGVPEMPMLLNGLALVIGIPFMFWVLIRPLPVKAARVSHLETALMKTQRDPEYIRFALSQAPRQRIDVSKRHIQIGPSAAPVTFTLLLNPVCKGCRDVYLQFRDLVRMAPDAIGGIVLFLSTLDDESEKKGGKSKDAIYARHIIALILSGVDPAAVLDDWFSEAGGAGGSGFKHWARRYKAPQSEMLKEAETLLEDTRRWAAQESFTVTPTVCLNDMKLPQDMRLEDMKIFILRQLG